MFNFESSIFDKEYPDFSKENDSVFGCKLLDLEKRKHSLIETQEEDDFNF